MRERKLLLRSRVALVTAFVVALGIIVVSVFAWFGADVTMRRQVDLSLQSSSPAKELREPGVDPESLCGSEQDKEGYQKYIVGIQLLRPDGTTCCPKGVDKVKLGPRDREPMPKFRDGMTYGHVGVRVLVEPIGAGYAVVTSRSMADVRDTLRQLGTVLGIVSVIGVAVAAVSGLLLTRLALRPVERLTRTVEHIAETEDLTAPVDVRGRDEIGRLGRAFSRMTKALAESRKRQQDLVADAAHELRTPLTSMRTNVDLLVRSEKTGRPIPDEQRRALLASLQDQARELGDLVGELVVLARDERETERVAVSMGAVVERAVERARARAQGHVFEVHSRPWTVVGDPGELERAVLNLLDNAVKFSPPASTVRVHSVEGEITVADAGPGVAPDERAMVFQRFWRSESARSLPGSGLGLAIVAQTAAAHGGSVEFVEPIDGIGAAVRFRLPVGRPDL
ncbi:HAMP domain-containing sensor histidine kinase [Allokutzneria albata]|uniref:histidine kinase n=1 Tax=Allokutzneria albata TaxID=211114 RepID=A0A1G9WMM5_ALLAB|nr:HAMP domain-containing sensor histidine kinase [Allokutzneria albata]SDM85607.1 two-component system, OmpR family, sensor histidine kinase MprB [Allokutzneria albata]